jgi:hypothetical protein
MKMACTIAPRLLPRPLHVPWYLDPSNTRSERWFAAADLIDIAAPAGRDTSSAEARERLERAATLSADAKTLADGGTEASASRATTFHLLAAELRREAGAWSLCAENYGALTRHYLSRGKLRPAVAYMRKMLFVTEGASASPDRLEACILAASVYVAVRQVAPARNAASEAAAIAVRLSDADGLAAVDRLLPRISELANACPTGKKPEPCACGSNEGYRACCGVADEVPAEFRVRPAAHGRRSAKIGPRAVTGQAGIDLLMELPGPEGECLNWVGVMVEDGRHSLITLPNWSGRAMRSARIMSKRALLDPDGTDYPSAAVLQVACGIEAFINTVEHFIGRSGPERFGHVRFPDFKAEGEDDSGEAGSTRRRWAGIGIALFGPDWAKEVRLHDLAKLMALRNALLHFKGAHEEWIIPAPAKEQALLNRFKDCFAMREPPRPWIDRVLTPGLATWAVDLGDGLIAAFRHAWHREEVRFEVESRDQDREEA